MGPDGPGRKVVQAGWARITRHVKDLLVELQEHRISVVRALAGKLFATDHLVQLVWTLVVAPTKGS
jgi:hypothetical protein